MVADVLGKHVCDDVSYSDMKKLLLRTEHWFDKVPFYLNMS